MGQNGSGDCIITVRELRQVNSNRNTGHPHTITARELRQVNSNSLVVVRTESRFYFVVVTLCDSCEVRTESFVLIPFYLQAVQIL
jgi:hypothetical protein